MSDDLLLTLSDDETFTPADASPPPGGEALALAARGDWARAERLFDDARAAATRAGDDVALAVALTNRGQALARLGRLEEAALTLDAALAVRRRLHEAGAAGEAVVARGVADVAALAAALGDLAEATRLLRLARGHAVAGAADDLVRAIDERLATARSLGAADEAGSPAGPAVEPASEPAGEFLVLEEPAVEEPTFVADTFAADTFEAGDFEGPALDLGVESFEVAPVADAGYEPLALDAAVPGLAGMDVPELAALPLLDEEETADAGPALMFLDAEPIAEPLPVTLEEPLVEAAVAELPVVPVESLLASAPEAAAAPLAESAAEPLVDDAWSLADPAPFEALDAEDVHARAVALGAAHPAAAFEAELEPTALARADALPALDAAALDAAAFDDDATLDAAALAVEAALVANAGDGDAATLPGAPTFGGEPTAADERTAAERTPTAALDAGSDIPPAPAFPEVYESPLAAAAPATRRRTTRETPTVTPPEPKRPWWRRLVRG